ncbi:MAG TPA: class I SAM-dependent methyltransferase [Actinomycetes bacterium]|nr:class I SAM-dependent methyltransferase [Actinomycetes bacterium]
MLELACGPGTWTPQLLDHAATVTAVDASREMIAIASATRRRGLSRPFRRSQPVSVAAGPAQLQQRLTDLGWRITVTPTSGPFYWGSGTRA